MTAIKWRATTASGTTYECEGGGIMRHTANNRRDYYHNPVLRSFPNSLIKDWTEVRWAVLGDLPTIKVPVVGEHLYILTAGDSGWVISTPIETLEVLA